MRSAKALFILFSITVSFIGSAKAGLDVRGLCQIVGADGKRVAFLDPNMSEQGLQITNESGIKKMILVHTYSSAPWEIDLSSNAVVSKPEDMDPGVGGFFNIRIGEYTSSGSGWCYKEDDKWLRFKYGETSKVTFPQNEAHQELSVECAL